jgi:hypothetical protein
MTSVTVWPGEKGTSRPALEASAVRRAVARG